MTEIRKTRRWIRRAVQAALAACSILACNLASAQGPVPGPGVAPNTGGPVAGFEAGGGGRSLLGGVSRTAPQEPLQFTPVYDVVPNQGYYGADGNVTTRRESTREPMDAHPIEQWIGATIGNGWIRMEYMNSHISGAGGAVLGSNTLLNANPNLPYELDNGGIGRTMDLSAVDFRGMNGLRLTYGVPLTFGEFEISGFILNQGSEKSSAPELPGASSGRYIATPVSFNHQITDEVRIYDESFGYTYTNETWGLQANLIYDYGQPGEGVHLFKPLVGVRWLDIREQLHQVGTYSNNGTDPAFTTTIDSESWNHIVGINFGFRSEIVHKWFTLGAEPKISLGGNFYKFRAGSDQFVTANDPRHETTVDGFAFSPIAEISVYGKVNVSENFSLFCSYSLLWASRVGRPYETIDYDVNATLGAPISSNIGAFKHFTDMQIETFTIGGEIRWK